MKNLLRTLS